MGICNCSMFSCALLCLHASFAFISMEMRDLVVLLYLSSWCFVIAVWLFSTMPWVCLQFVIVVFPVYTHLLLLLVRDSLESVCCVIEQDIVPSLSNSTTQEYSKSSRHD